MHLCHHLAFRQKEIDWQIWIEDSPTPLPRKFLITDKQAKGLQFTAWLSQWNTAPQLEDGLFVFVVPAKAEKVDLRPVAATCRAEKDQKMIEEDAAMLMMKRKKWMPKTLIVLVSVVALGGLLPVNPGNTLLSHRRGGLGRLPSALGVALAPARGYGGGAVGVGAGAPARGAAGAPVAAPRGYVHTGGGVGTSAGVGGGAVGAGPGVPARGAAGAPGPRY